MIHDFLINTVTFNSIIGICLYWLPLALCSIGYLVRSSREYHTDIEKRTESENNPKQYYNPTIRIGTLIGRCLISIVPIVNLLAAIFDISPIMFKRILDWIVDVFDRPLVPKRKE